MTTTAHARARRVLVAVTAVLALASGALAAAETPSPRPSVSPAASASPALPVRRDATPDRIALLKVPSGFTVDVFARDLKGPRMLAIGEDGTIYVSQPERGEVIALRDDDGDGRADRRRLVAGSVAGVHGLAVRRGELWMATPGEVYVAAIDREHDGVLGLPRALVKRLPAGRRHLSPGLALGPDDLIYLSLGATCDACREADARSATMLRIGAGPTPAVFARGLRNTIGFDWHPQTHELWGMDDGTEDRGSDVPPEELNRLKEGADYGWPYVYGKREVDAAMDDPPDTTKEKYAATTEPSVLDYQAHSAPTALLFYSGDQFPAEYRGDAFVAMHGSWNRDPPTGYEVVRIRFDHGTPKGFEDFLTGFLVEHGKAQFGRPTGLALAKDGALLVSDDSNGVIYRVRYGTAASPSPAAGARP